MLEKEENIHRGLSFSFPLAIKGFESTHVVFILEVILVVDDGLIELGRIFRETGWPVSGHGDIVIGEVFSLLHDHGLPFFERMGLFFEMIFLLNEKIGMIFIGVGLITGFFEFFKIFQRLFIISVKLFVYFMFHPAESGFFYFFLI